MATKDCCLFLKDEKEFVNRNAFSNQDTQQYSNLNLNANQKFSSFNAFQTQSETTAASLKKIDHQKEHNISGKDQYCCNNLLKNFRSLNINDSQKIDMGNQWKKKDDSTKNGSTLSLHISAYENSVEASTNDSKNGENMQPSKKQSKVHKILENSNVFTNYFEIPRMQSSSEEEAAAQPEIMHFKASQKLLGPKSSNKKPILRAGTKHHGSQNAFLNFLKKGRLGNGLPADSLAVPSSSTNPTFESIDDVDFDYGDGGAADPGDLDNSMFKIDDIRVLTRFTDVEFTETDKQLILLHNRLRSSEAENHYFRTQSIFQLVTGVPLPYSVSIDKKLQEDFKKLWKLEANFFCSSCLTGLRSEGSKCTNQLCQHRNGKNLVICVSDVRQDLLHILKKFGDFSSVENGDDVMFKLTINTDGIVPKGHGQTEIWPVYLQIADLPDHVKGMVDSVALQSVIVDNGKPSEFAFEKALLNLVEWLHDQGEGLKLQISTTKLVKVFFQIHNLSADLAATCHLFHFASWSSSSEACMLCKVKPVRAHGASRWNILDENLIRRNNLNITLDMLRKQGGFKEGATFWMQLVNVLEYRFDNLHKICEGVCASLLKEFFGTSKKMGNTLKIRQLTNLENVIKNINWPTKTKIIFTKLNSGTAYEKLGSFLVAVPLALPNSKMKYEYIVWILGILSIIYSEFCTSTATVNKKTLLQKLARLQVLLCGTVFSTLKFHYFFVHLYEKTDLVEKTSTFIFETLNRYIKMKFDPNHQKGFTSAILEKFLLERAVRYELQQRSQYCPEVKQYIEQIDWRIKNKKGIEINGIILKGEIRTIESKQFFERFLRHGKTYSTTSYNPVNCNIIFEHNDERHFGKILDIFKSGDTVQSRIQIFKTSSIHTCFDDFEHIEGEEACELAAEIKGNIFKLLGDHIRLEKLTTTNPTIVTTNIANILGHCLEVPFNGKTFFFDLAMKAESK